jgi:hypothetical protein
VAVVVAAVVAMAVAVAAVVAAVVAMAVAVVAVVAVVVAAELLWLCLGAGALNQHHRS